MGIFRPNESFSKVLVVWGTRAQALVVQETIYRMAGSLEG
jgi:hypothetical protein